MEPGPEKGKHKLRSFILKNILKRPTTTTYTTTKTKSTSKSIRDEGATFSNPTTTTKLKSKPKSTRYEDIAISTSTTTAKPKSKATPSRYEDTIFSTSASLYSTSGPYLIHNMAPGNPFSLFRARTDDSDSSKSEPDHSRIIRFYDPYIEGVDANGRTLNTILEWSDRRLETSHDYIQMLFPLPESSPYNFNAPIVNRVAMEAFHARQELRNMLQKSLVRMLKFYGFTAVSEEEAREIEKAKKMAEAIESAEANQESEKASGIIEGDQPESSANDHIEVKAPQTSTNAQEPQAQRIEPQSEVPVTSNSILLADQSIEPSNSNTATSDQTAEIPKALVSESKSSTDLLSSFVVIRGPNWAANSQNWCMPFDHNHLRITRILRCLRVFGLDREMEAFFLALQEVFNDPRSRIGGRSISYWKRAVRLPLDQAPDGEHIHWLRVWLNEKAELVQTNTEESESIASGVRSEKTKAQKSGIEERRPLEIETESIEDGAVRKKVKVKNIESEG